MEHIYSICFKRYFCLLACLVFLTGIIKSQNPCGPLTPTFAVNLSGNPDSAWISPAFQRDDFCCGATSPDKCLMFLITLDPNAMGINFYGVSGAFPGGSLFYQINCGPLIAFGTPICLSGAGPHVLTFCKPGNNVNEYGITSIPKPVVPDSILVRNGCSATLAVSGFSVPTITWTSVFPGLPGAYNSYLNCTVGCATVVATPTGTPPPYVDYVVGGFGQSPCQANYYQDTVRVYYYTDLLTGIIPTQTTICFGSSQALLTATAVGGLAPYNYKWVIGTTTITTGVGNNTVSVGVGTYSVLVSDATGCPPTMATATVNQFTLAITADTGPNQTLCKSSPTVTLNGSVTIATGGLWSGGTGTFTPSASSLNISYIPTVSEVNTGSVQLYLITTGNQGCPPGKDTVNITFQNTPVVNAGADRTVCANNNLVSLSGTITGFPSTPLWTSMGSGTLTANSNTNTNYLPSSADISVGTVNVIITTTNNGVCPPARDTVKVFIVPKPIVNAGPDQTICSINSAALNATVSVASTTGTWTTNGDGTFSSGTALNATYTPGTNDINTGTVSLILTSTNNSVNCLAEKDTVKLTIRKIAVVNAGLNQVLCSNAGTIGLSGSVTGGTTTGAWSANGPGAFSPTTTTLNPFYTMTSTDITNGSVIFTLTSASNGPCPAVTDTVKINIRQIATTTAGINQWVCSNQNTISLAGIITGPAGTGTWAASGTGSFSPNNSSLSTSYSITSADITNGFVTFTLTSTNNSVCPAVTDTVKMRINKIATVNAGLNQNYCSTTSGIVLNGSVTASQNTGVWTTNGTGGFNPGTAALTTTYLPTSTDKANGFVTFTLTSTNNGPCPTIQDTVTISILTLAQPISGPGQQICSTQNNITLNGSVLGASGTGSWSTSGTGGFSPGNTSLLTSYSVTPVDITAGQVTFTLTSTGNGACPPVRDSLTVRIIKLAVVTTGSNQSICSSQNSITLTGSVVGGGGGGSWTSSGTGSFVPGPNQVNTTYVISPGDIANVAVTLTLSSVNSIPCSEVQDTMMVTIRTLANTNAGPNQVVCSNTDTISLIGIISAGGSTGAWTSNGTGTISSNTNLVTTYSMSVTDIISGSVIFTLTSTNNGGCPAVSDSAKIIIKQWATVNGGVDKNICSTTTNIAVTGTVLGSTSTGSWSTTGAGNFVNPNSLSTSYNISTADVNSGTVFLILTSTNNDICPARSDSVKVQITKNSQVILRLDTTVCEKQNPIQLLNAQIINIGTGTPHWMVGGTHPGTFVPNNYSIPTYYYFSADDISAGTAIITLAVENNTPCPTVSSSGGTLHIRPSAKAGFSVADTLINIPAPPVVFTNHSLGADSYQWTFGDGGTSKLKNPTRNYTTVGYFTVTLIANNQYDCSDTTEKVMTVISEVRFPNAFTPNPNGPGGGTYTIRDLTNDVFFPYTGGVTEYELIIFNRWGELIFRSNDINIGWDGYFNGKICQQDAYVWKANMKFFDGRTYNKTGTVTLLR
jgi:gliding motility-associated-like protein